VFGRKKYNFAQKTALQKRESRKLCFELRRQGSVTVPEEISSLAKKVHGDQSLRENAPAVDARKIKKRQKENATAPD